jgi:hypothetical protein
MARRFLGLGMYGLGVQASGLRDSARALLKAWDKRVTGSVATDPESHQG